jgi:hypothetical protein
MSTSIKKVIPKKRGRKPTGKDPARAFRLSDEFMEDVDAWAAGQPDAPGRSEAVRRLVELGLKVKTPARSVSNPGRKLRAQELATKAIDKMIDPSAPQEERAQRRQRLTKGPTEFRDHRVDLPKKQGK